MSLEDLRREIPLTQGQSAIVDEADYHHLMQWKWFAIWAPNARSYYAVRTERDAHGRPHAIRMHRELLGLKCGDALNGDHINGNTLDNRRFNLRVATIQQNNCNQRKRRRNKSGYKGVSWCASRRKWCAQIQSQGRKINLGLFASINEAYGEYCRAVVKYHGKFGRIE